MQKAAPVIMKIWPNQRAEAVKNRLQKNGKIDPSCISVHPVGEAKPVRSNKTATGRPQNHHVEIAVRNS